MCKGGSGGASQGLRTDIQPQLLEALPSRVAVLDVSCGLGHALFLLKSGAVLAWGNGGNGRLGLGDCNDRLNYLFVLLFVFNLFCSYLFFVNYSL